MNKALILVDIQNDYFPGGKFPLVNIEVAAENAAKLLSHFREKELPIFHIQHIEESEDAPFFAPNTEGNQINSTVSPNDGETLIIKHYPNSFLKTELKEKLDALNIEQVVVCGAMSHMCIDATSRAALDFEYEVSVVQDACATRDLEHNGTQVPAKQVHAALMAALEFAGCDVINLEEIN